MYAIERNDPSTRWISVAFLQGEEAERLLTLIDREGPISAIYQLRELDHGDETIEAALVNGYVYDAVPAGSTDHTIEPYGSPYALTYSDTFGYVSLLRRYEPMRSPDSVAALAPFERTPQSVASEWMANPSPVAVAPRQRSVAM
ncbi:hypothetical protein [Agromyces sp. Marseille-Q5079]|uniref:hypothetical protein n=1 Tax=Agromyces sp. Marseille-Q5079 TaxID=3439059 RepID=UPI003D9C840F